MRKFFIIFLSGFLYQCSADIETPEPKATSIDKEFQLAINQHALLQNDFTSDAGKLQVVLRTVKDSRCPEDVICAWAGYAAVTISVLGSDKFPDELDLCLGDCFQRNTSIPSYNIKDSVEVNSNGKIYIIILKDILPYPISADNISDKHKTALFEIKLK